MKLHGIIPPLATPFTRDEAIDETILRHEVDRVIRTGVHGITVTGSTGEGHTLTIDELVRASAAAVEAADGRVPVITGIIRDSTRDVITCAQAVKTVGISAIQVTPVHYLFQPDEEGSIDFYRRIGNEVELPIVIYNVVPWNTLSPEVVLRLSELPQVVAVKQSGGDIHKLARLLTLASDRLTILTAVDDLLMPSFLLGAHGAVAAILTVLPELCCQLWDACQSGQLERARSLHERILTVWNTLAAPDLPARVKAALALLGHPVGGPRHPLRPVSPTVEEAIRQALIHTQLLPAQISGQ